MKNSKGFSLLEIVITIGLLGILAAGYFGALNTNLKVLIYTDEQQTAKTIAEHQLECVKDQDYSPTYTPVSVSGDYPGYSATISTVEVVSRDTNLQKISVTVSHQSKPIIMVGDTTLQGFKVKR